MTLSGKSRISFFSAPLRAQDVTVTVTPTQPILPPQVMLYITEPANYFNISLTNTGKDIANVYLVMQVEQVNPSSGLSITTPANRQPKMPIVVPANGSRILAPAEVRGLFNHIPLNEIKAPNDLFDNYTNGSFGLLPEGQYELHFTAYRWDPTLPDPVVASSPTGGLAVFNVCYKAQAPEFLTPAVISQDLMAVAEIDPLAPQFTWKAPVVACNPTVLQYTYSLRIVEVLPNQLPDNSMDHNPVVYQASNLSTPMCMIPQTVIKQMKEGTTYAAQVTAVSANVNKQMLNYVSIENDGKSTYKLFRLKASEKPKVVPNIDQERKNDDVDEELKKKEEEDKNKEDEEGFIRFGKSEGVGTEDKDSLFTYRNPVLLAPSFVEGGVRQVFTNDPIEVKWDPVWHIGGAGKNPDDNKFEYEVRLYKGDEEADREETMKTEPIWKLRTKELTTTIEWEDIEKKTKVGDYLLLEVKPIITKGKSIAFTEDDNINDFGLNERLSRKYFQCEARVEINDKNPTSKSAQDLKGKVVAIGEYFLTIDDIKGSGDMGFSGSGRVEWKPFGASIMVCVTFDNLKINKSDIVYEGICVSAKAPEMLSSMAVVDKLFSDWGIDNLIGESGLPYADKLQTEATGKIKSIAEKANIGDYYAKIQKGKDLFKLLTSGKMDKLYMPVKFPTEVLPSKFDAVDLQIVEMKFAATYATMNIMGEAIMPECDVLKSKVLLFGAPRICISTNKFLPDDGQIALLGDFTLTPSDMEITFKAPKDPITPKDGCYISWNSTEKGSKLELLGIDADMKVEGMYKEVNGKLTNDLAVMNLRASVGSWDDLLVDNISVEDFQLKDLPGWTFQAQDVVYDHSDYRNSDKMGEFPSGYDKKESECDKDINKWHGLHIGKVGVAFPKSLELGDIDEEHKDKRLWVGAKEMFIDKSGVTVIIGANNVFEAKEGTLGGWGISLDEAHVQIIQNDFDNCGFTGQINVPILKRQKGSEHEGEFGNVKYTCQIRDLSNPKNEKGKKNTKDKPTRLSYIFLTEQVEPLDFSFLVAQAELDPVQTYFLVDAYDDDKKPGEIKTQIELCLGGDIGIGLIDNANAWLKEKTESLPLQLKIPELHFTKMRFSNVSESDDWVINDKRVEDKRKARDEKAQAIHDAALKILVEGKEFNVGTTQEPFYIDLGEWSFSSAPKHLGPFSFNLTEFKPNFESKNKKVTLEVGGSIGLCEVLDVGAKVLISAKVDIPDIKKPKTWSISDGDVEFKKLELDLDWTALHFHGELEATTEPDKGYSGALDIEIVGFFKLDCKGGYYEHKKDEKDNNDRDFAWGYFMASIESGAGIHVDPVVINRISGGFFFNCRPTKGKNKFDGDPKAAYGNIGVAFGLGLSTTAGEQALKADLDMLVVYDSYNKCLSTFMLNGKVEAVGGMIKAECSLIYENEKNTAHETVNRYLCLNLTVEAGMDSNALLDKVKGMNASLEKLQGKLDEFQGEIDGVYQRVKNASSGMGALSGDYENPNSDGTEVKEKNKEQSKEFEASAGSVKVSLEFKVTWVKDKVAYKTPKWHLYLGEPDKAHRCTFTYLKFKSPICSVDIGADGYLCLGNELPNGGALPDIPDKITKFLAGEKSSTTDMGADLGKAQRSRKAAAKALLDPNSLNGGVMVGASAWGSINIDLGLLYGSLEAIAGFDAALVNYGDMAYCMNSGKAMGYKGWYAMGQLYAYLAAELGVHIHIGNFINEKISILDAGIGGVLEMGLPNPTWMEGSARIKISLLGGLCKINKKFDFSAGDHCVPFKGNALDGFEMFQSVSHGSDSLYQALLDPTFAISVDDAKHMTFTTQSSIGSHYRLLDPSWEAELADKDETTEEDIEKAMALNASRTYVFDMDQDLNYYGMKKGVRLFDLGTAATDLIKNGKGTKDELDKAMRTNTYWTTAQNAQDDKPLFKNLSDYVSNIMYERSGTVAETSMIMSSPELNSSVTDYLADTWQSRIDEVITTGTLTVKDGKKNVQLTALEYNPTEVNCSFREQKGTTFHLTGMNLKPGHSYVLFLMADAYEIDNGRRVWCEYIKDGKPKRIHWRQTKAWFFRVKSNTEDKIITDSLRDLEPYIALAYPSYNGTRVLDNHGEGDVRAYFDDIMKPTIALNRDIRTSLPANKMKWVLEGYTAAGDTLKPQTRNAVYQQNGNCINLEPSSPFKPFDEFTAAAKGKSNYDFSQEKYRLKLLYTYRHKELVTGQRAKFMKDPYYDRGDSTVALVDMPIITLPHDVTLNRGTFTDSWKVVTQKENTELLAYTKPFVGATMDSIPNILYESDYTSKGLTDEDFVFKNTKFESANLPYRLIDPYMYFAYLGKWVFIGDREIGTYAFDNTPVKFGSESLIYNYNGTVVNSEFLKVDKKKGEKNKTLLELRDQMYSVWNTWNYNDGNHPKYPLPSVGSTIGGVTANNQDGKTSTVTPIDINHVYTVKLDYSYVFEDLVKDYVAVYNVADQLSTKLRSASRDVLNKFYNRMNIEKGSCNSKLFNTNFNYDLKQWNNLHRGQYIEIEDRGYNVRVPYYQLPLIFGGCFGSDNDVAVYGAPTSNPQTLDKSYRTLGASIGEDDLSSGDGDPEYARLSKRWDTQASNLLFFRLCGATKGDKIYGYDNYLFSVYKELYDNNYPSSYHVNWDDFQRNKALEQVTRFKARIYRVDGYDIDKGLYVVTDKNKGRGGGPWEESVNIGMETSYIKNLADMYKSVEEQDAYRETHYDKQIPQVLWCNDTKTLIFLCTSQIWKAGDKYPSGGKDMKGTVTWVYTEDRVKDKNWRNYTIMQNCTNVYVNQSFGLRTYEGTDDLKGFFEDFKKLTTVKNVGVLTSASTKDMSYMFKGCEKLTDVDFDNKYYTTWTKSVTSMSHMFDGCKSLKKLDLTQFNTSKVRGMTSMFEGCESLTSVDLSSFTGESLMGTSYMFYGCKNLSSIDISTIGGVELTSSVSRMFEGCTALRTLHMDILDPRQMTEWEMRDMFKGVSNRLTCYYYSGLHQYIVKQIPGTKKAVADQRAKVVYGRCSNGDEALFFLFTPNKFKVGYSYTITPQYVDLDGSMSNSDIWNKKYPETEYNVTVKGVWQGDDVTNTWGAPQWSTGASTVKYVYIDKAFSSAKPASTYSWFKNFSNVRAFHGLCYLNTELVTDMSYMFQNCSQVERLGLGNFDSGGFRVDTKFQVANVTKMTSMFQGCSKLEELSMYKWDVSKVTTTYNMFNGCSKLTFTDYRTKWPLNDFKNVTDMSYMFANCSSLENTDPLYGLRIATDKVTDMSRMFSGCSSMKVIPYFTSTEKVTKMNGMFSSCSNLQKADFTPYKTDNLKQVERMFDYCSSMEEINLGNNTLSQVTSATDMFRNVNKPSYIYLPGDATRIINVCSASTFPNRIILSPAYAIVLRSGSYFEMMLYGKRTTLKSGDRCDIYPYEGYTVEKVLSSTNIQNSTDRPEWENWYSIYPKIKKIVIHSSFSDVPLLNAKMYFADMSELTEIKGLGNLDVSKAKDVSYMFSGCPKLETVDGTIYLTSATNAASMFWGCKSLKKIPVSFSTSDVLIRTDGMFQGCSSVSEIGSSYNYPRLGNVENMSYMFSGCSNLYNLAISRLNTSKATTMEGMFSGCSSLSESSLKGIKSFDTKNVTSMAYMLKGTQMSELDLSTWNTGAVTNMSGMFADCSQLRKVQLGSNWTLSNLKSYTTTAGFSGVHDLAVLVPAAKLSSIKSAFTDKQGFKVGSTGQFYDENVKGTAQVIWTRSNKTLTFYYGMPVGSTFNNLTVTQKWTGDDVLSNSNTKAKWIDAVKGDVTTVTFDKTFSEARPTTTKGWFNGCKKLTTINGLENLCTCYSVTDMSYMFNECEGLTELSFDNSRPLWGTSKVTNMSSMFSGCKNLKKLVLTRFNTEKVTNMFSLFYDLRGIEKLDVSMFNTSSVTTATYLFYYMTNLRTLIVGSNFTFPKLSSTAYAAFSGVKKCEITATSTVINSVKSSIKSKLGFIEKTDDTNGDFVASDSKSVQAIWTKDNKTLTFYYGKQYKKDGKFNGKTITEVWSVRSGYTPWRDTVKGIMTTATIDPSMADYGMTSYSYWFADCAKLTTINGLTNLKTSSCTSYSYMFSGCSALTTLDVSKFMTDWSLSQSTRINLSGMFYNCESLKSLDVSQWTETKRVSSMSYMFKGCSSLTKLDMSKWNTQEVTTMCSMFSGCTDLTSISFGSSWNTSKVTDMSYMFMDCESLKYIPVEYLNPQSVTTMRAMFKNCYDWAASFGPYAPWKWNVEKVKDMSEMFFECESVTSLNLTEWKTSSVTNMSNMFAYCKKITDRSTISHLLDVSKLDVSKVTDMSGMFKGCGGIRDLDLSQWNTNSLTNMKEMFYYCSKLETIDLSHFDLSKVTNMYQAFYNCTSANTVDLRVSKVWKASTKNCLNYAFSYVKGHVLLNHNAQITGESKYACSNYSNQFLIRDCDSGTYKTDMVKTLKNLGSKTYKALPNATQEWKDRDGKIWWYTINSRNGAYQTVYE